MTTRVDVLLNPNTISGDSQVSMTVDTCQRLGCLHGSDRYLSTCSNSSLIQDLVPSFHVRKSGLPIQG